MHIFITVLLIATFISVWMVGIRLMTDNEYIMERFRQIEEKIDKINSL